MIKVALTGNIGSGKSTVASIFESLHVPVFHADEEAKKFLLNDEVITEIVEKFGIEIQDTNFINRQKLAEIVFRNESKLDLLNAIIHPRVRKALHLWLDTKKSSPYVIQEAAILFESGFHKEFDKTVLVSCPQEIAIQRVMLRDEVSRENVLHRIENQWSEERKMAMSDYIIYNDDENMLIPQVLELHKIFNSG